MKTQSMNTQTVEESIKQYLSVWNVKGAENIKAALEKCWTADSTYADQNNAPVKGFDAMAELIGRAHERSPEGIYSQTSPPDFHHESGCFRWRLTKGDGETLDGLDYFEYNSKNEIVRIVAFISILSS